MGGIMGSRPKLNTTPHRPLLAASSSNTSPSPLSYNWRIWAPERRFAQVARKARTPSALQAIFAYIFPCATMKILCWFSNPCDHFISRNKIQNITFQALCRCAMHNNAVCQLMSNFLTEPVCTMQCFRTALAMLYLKIHWDTWQSNLQVWMLVRSYNKEVTDLTLCIG